MNESFWDAQNVEIEACAKFDIFRVRIKNCRPGKDCGFDALGTAEVWGEGREISSRSNNLRILPVFRGRVELFSGEWHARAELRHRNNSFATKLLCFKLDAVSVPEALATTIRILLMFSIVSAHRASGDPRAAPGKVDISPHTASRR